jgi:hypothetical protein
MDKKRKRRWGDRSDGRRLRSLDPINALMLFIMKTRNSSNNNFSDSVDISEAEKYLKKMRKQGYPGLGYLHLFVAAYIRLASQYPGVNRFISGQRIFARDNIEFVMALKKGMSIEEPETTIKVLFDKKDTIIDVYNTLNAEINNAKNERESNAALIIAKAFMKLPRVIIKFAIFFLEFLDYFGIMPKFILNASPFHGSLFITDLGSIGLKPVFHHLYDFGNIPVFIAIGAKRRASEIGMDGKIYLRKIIDYKVVVDDRICDGFYFSQATRLYKHLIRKPQELEKPPETVVEDVE